MNVRVRGIVHGACSGEDIHPWYAACVAYASYVRGLNDPVVVGDETEDEVDCMVCMARLGFAEYINSLNWVGRAVLYRLSVPLEGYTYVVVSAADVPFSGPETYIFESNERGENLSGLELEGSFRGSMSHSLALAYAGYIISKKELS